MNSPPDLTVVIDLGKSLIKVIYAIALGHPKILFLEPGVAELTESECRGMQPSATASPEDDAWIELPSGQRVALGFKAETQFALECDPKQGKYKSVVGALRCLAIVGAIAQKENLGQTYKNFDPNGQSIALGSCARLVIHILLPIAEMSQKDGLTHSKLYSDLIDGLQSWTFRGVSYSIDPKQVEVDIRPEGFGQLLTRRAQLGLEGFKKKNILLLVMGQYNVTAMLYARGQCVRAESPSKGFHDLVKEVETSTSLDASAISSTKLIEAIYYGRVLPEKLRALLAGKVESSEHLDALTKELKSACDRAFCTYWKSVSNWLNTFLGCEAVSVTEVLVSGGAATAFKKELEDFFNGAKIIWAGGLKQKISQAFDLKSSDPMIYRLADAYGIFKWTSEVHSTQHLVESNAKVSSNAKVHSSQKGRLDKAESTPDTERSPTVQSSTVPDVEKTDSPQLQSAKHSGVPQKQKKPPTSSGSSSIYERLRIARNG